MAHTPSLFEVINVSARRKSFWHLLLASHYHRRFLGDTGAKPPPGTQQVARLILSLLLWPVRMATRTLTSMVATDWRHWTFLEVFHVRGQVVFMKVSLFVLLGLAAILASGFFLITSSLRQEYLMSNFSRLFPEIVIRAIQLEKMGETGIATQTRYNQNSVFPPEMDNSLEKMRELFNTGQRIDCSSGIVMVPVNPRETDPVIGVMLSYRPLRYVVVFYGQPPDISAFMNPETGPELLGEVFPFELNSLWGSDFPGLDVTRDFENVSRQYPSGVKWNPVECKNFSYIEFTE